MENQDPHKPVLIDSIIELASPIAGVWLDGTFGAGGYSKAILEAGADQIIGIDRDPLAHEMAAKWLPEYHGKIELNLTTFAKMDHIAEANSLDGIVLDIGVSSMQLDIAERGFSFMRDGPLDMRMSQHGSTAADLCNSLGEEELADILYVYGEERASRRIARAIVAARKISPLTRTHELAAICQKCLPSKKPHDPHPATRSFQALRIAVNGELDELKTALEKSVLLLKPGGLIVIVSFHSLEDRIVKQFFAEKSGKNERVNRYLPEPSDVTEATLKILTKKPVTADKDEQEMNPRSRSAKLRIAQKVGLVV